MADRNSQPVLRRMVKSRPGAPAPGYSPLEQALARSVPKAADEALGLAVTLTEITQTRKDGVRQVTEANNLHDLFLLMENSAGMRAAAQFDPGLLTALLQVQTMGCVAPGQTVTRVPTPTDAALASGFMDGVMRGAEAVDAGAVLQGYRVARHVESQRALSLLLEDGPFLRVDVGLDLAAGAAQGQLTLLLPQPVDKPDLGSADGPADTTDFGAAVLEFPVRLRAVLHRCKIPLAEFLALKPGDVIPIPRAAVAKIRVETHDGEVMFQGRLGQSGGMKSVKFTPDGLAAPRPQVLPQAAPGALKGAVTEDQPATVPAPSVAPADLPVADGSGNAPAAQDTAPPVQSTLPERDPGVAKKARQGA